VESMDFRHTTTIVLCNWIFNIFWKKRVPGKRRCTKAYAHHLDFQCINWWYAFSIFKKHPLFVNFSIIPCEKKKFSQCSTALTSVIFSGHISNSLIEKNKMLHNPCLLGKVVSWAFLTILSPFGSGEKWRLVNLNVMIL
jgi:hypothetical protein